MSILSMTLDMTTVDNRYCILQITDVVGFHCNSDLYDS